MRDGTSQRECLPARHFVGRGLQGYVFQTGHCGAQRGNLEWYDVTKVAI